MSTKSTLLAIAVALLSVSSAGAQVVSGKMGVTNTHMS
jgi:hypothetical protein